MVFLGTPQFAVPSLEALIASGNDVQAVFTQPDRPKGRGNQVAESPVKAAATNLGLTVYQPEKIRRPEQVELLKSLRPEMMVVVGYGQIIPQNIIDLPRHGILNVHASLLPKYRGAAPIQWAIANGETSTGVTVMQIDAGLDTGDMLLRASVAIGAEETSSELSARLAELGADQLLKVISHIKAGEIEREKQNDAEATLAPILRKEDGEVQWSRTAAEIYNRLRGFMPWPGAYTSFRGQQLSLVRAKPGEGVSAEPGTVIADKRRLVVSCGGGTALELTEVQLAGKKRMSGEAFLNGYRPEAAEILGGQH